MIRPPNETDWPDFERKRYVKLGDGKVWAITYKVGSTSLRRKLYDQKAWPDPSPHRLKSGDHVTLLVRHPHDRLVSAWRWFTQNVNSYIPGILRDDPKGHALILDEGTPFNVWVPAAIKHWNPHWVPATDIHPRWREFELMDLAVWGKQEGHQHQKQTRDDNSWEQYYDEATLALANEVYSEDLEMWKEIKDGTDTRANRIL